MTGDLFVLCSYCCHHHIFRFTPFMCNYKSVIDKNTLHALRGLLLPGLFTYSVTGNVTFFCVAVIPSRNVIVIVM